MYKKPALFVLFLFSHLASAQSTLNLYSAPLTRLKDFNIMTQSHERLLLNSGTHSIAQLSKTQQNNEQISRYQQLYKGLPVIGAQVTISNRVNAPKNNSKVNGVLFSQVNLNTKPMLSKKNALILARKQTQQFNIKQIYQENTELQIRTIDSQELQLVYLISFKSISSSNKPIWPFFIVDANTGKILKTWNNAQTYLDKGPGGNEKTHEYWYGQDNLPNLTVSKQGTLCVLEDDKVKVININKQWDWQALEKEPYHYRCDSNTEDAFHGAFSVENDAYFFGHTIIDLYKNWYDLNALQDETGSEKKLIMRVHFGTEYDNAFWDGETMAFGDGNIFYPLVTLDITAHEVSHGFTQQHSSLEYHDESGALNESFSDMAAQAAKAYLLSSSPALYKKAYLNSNELTWLIGETVIPPNLPMTALRFMDIPSKDHMSADCVNKSMARSEQSICAISYSELLNFADENSYGNELLKQSIIVHTGSGIYNRAFYLFSKELGIREAFNMMLLANMKYWTPSSNFASAACGVSSAANDLKINSKLIESTFKKVGIDTKYCAVNIGKSK